MSKKPYVQCEFFRWKLFQREGVWYADGRGQHKLGKHSLGTRDHKEAVELLRKLDRRKAIEMNLVKAAPADGDSDMSIESGWKLFEEHCRRPEIMGGVSASTWKRYRAIRDKHVEFCRGRGVETWSRFDKQQADNYGRHLDSEGYAQRTLFIELNTVRSVVLWLVEEGELPEACRFRLRLRRPEGTDTYCYSAEEVRAMVAHCMADPELKWLADVITALACTGLRISELAALRQSDVDQRSNVIRLTDERSSNRRHRMGTARRTKGRRDRTVPIFPQLTEVLDRLPKCPDGRLFHGPRGGRLKPDTVRNVLLRDVIEPLAERFPTPKGEIGFQHGRVHSFRHYFVSQAFLGGATEVEIMDWVGHRESRMVHHYRHLQNATGERKIRQIDFLGADLNPADPEK